MAELTSGSNSSIWISPTLPATEDETGYEALTWTKIPKVTGNWEIGDEYDLIEFNANDSDITEYVKGNRKMGTIPLVYGVIVGNAGQELVLDAVESKPPYSFKIVKSNGSIKAFKGLVSTGKEATSSGSVDTVSASIQVVSKLVTLTA